MHSGEKIEQSWKTKIRNFLSTNRSTYDEVQMKCVVETRNAEHARLLKRTLLEKEYPLIWDIDADDAAPWECPST